MANSFEVGDVVRLKSGGPPMTIDSLDFSSGASVRCIWFVESKPVVHLFVPTRSNP